MPRTLRSLLAGSAVAALALGGCTATIEADEDSMCSALKEVLEHPEFAGKSGEYMESFLLLATADAIETRELVDFVAAFDAAPPVDTNTGQAAGSGGPDSAEAGEEDPQTVPPEHAAAPSFAGASDEVAAQPTRQPTV